MNLLDVKKATVEKQLKIVQIGESGSGKTHRALSALQYGPMFFFDCDNKLANYASSGKLTDQQLEQVDFMVPKSTSEILNQIAILEKAGESIKFATIVLDTFSRWNELVIEELIEKNNGQPLRIQDWGTVKVINARFLKRIFSLPCNVIINAHLAEKENAVGESGFTAGGSGSAAQMLPEFVDECHYLYIKKPNNTHTVQGKGSGKFTVVKTLLTQELDGLVFKSASLDIFKNFAKIIKPGLTNP